MSFAPIIALHRGADTTALARFTAFLALASLPFFAAHLLDQRMVMDEAVWIKPLKFFAAFGIYIGTLAVFARWLPPIWASTRLWRGYLVVVMACILAELVWISAAAALGTRSHFNDSSALWTAIYPLMGLAAMILTSASLVMGIGIWRNSSSPLAPALRLSIALGLILTFAMTVVIANVMAGSDSHLIGVPISGARLPIMGWSREVGDLRAPHFLATHAMHGVPLAGLAALFLPRAWQSPAVWVAAIAYAALTAWAFWQALAGLPPI